jgi:hypothetical protein
MENWLFKSNHLICDVCVQTIGNNTNKTCIMKNVFMFHMLHEFVLLFLKLLQSSYLFILWHFIKEHVFASSAIVGITNVQ